MSTPAASTTYGAGGGGQVQPQPRHPVLHATTFTSVLPIVDDLIRATQDEATRESEAVEGEGLVAGVESPSDRIASLARELSSTLNSMKRAASTLPGGHLSTERIKELDGIMKEEAQKRRELLARYGAKSGTGTRASQAVGNST